MPIPPDEPTDADWLLLSRYCGGQCTPAEQRRVQEWIAGDSERKAWVESLQVTWQAARSVPSPAQALSSLRRAKVRLGLPPAPGALPQTLPVPSQRGSSATLYQWPRGMGAVGVPLTRRGPLLATGAAIAVMVTLALGLVMQHRLRSVVPAREYATAAGQRLNVTLGDGTRLTLAPASRLYVPAGYGHHARVVQLDGEAYFVVAHDAARPFMVQARNAVATDVGTAFDIRAYATANAVRVAVTDGRVFVARRGSARTAGRADDREALVRGDLASLTDTTMVVTHHADVTALTSWTTGHLVFRNTPLAEALEDVGRWYDLDIQLARTDAPSGHVTATFDDEPADQVLHALALALEIRFESRGRTLIAHRVAGP